MLNDLVQIRNIDVRYGWRTVLKSVSLSVRAGEVWLLLGPNAAGKTTLLRTLAGSLKPAKGKIIFKNEGNTAKTIGWVDHQSFLYDELTVQENLQFWANLSAVDSSKKRIDELIERFDLALFRHEKFEVLSFGMKKRVTICRAILARPDLLLLDEAFNGLDQVGTERLTDLLTDYRQSTSAVILTSHQVSAVLPLATDVAVLHRGRLILSGPVRELDSAALRENYFEYALRHAEKAVEK
jgi:heme ABC exporter ATP-binding subunit CcmA